MSTFIHHNDEIGSPARQRVLRVVVFAIVGILMFRLYQLQLYYNVELGKKSTENSLRSIAKEPIRGYIFDRNGSLLVDVGPSYTVMITPAEFDPRTLPLVSSILRMDPESIKDRLERGRAYSRFSPTRVKRDVDFKTLSALEEKSYLLPGLDYQVESKRYYPTNARAPHLLGYCKEISDAQLASMGEYYKLGDLIGFSGLEASYETMLRGQKGFEFIAVNARGQTLGPFEDGRNDILPKEGFDLILGLDSGLQAFAESLMTDSRGALVALDPSDGSILALVSKPDFDPSLFSGVTPAEEWTRLNTDSTKPMFNRATMTRYPPGSTFKMVLAAAALQEGIIDETYRIVCHGAYRFGNRTFNDMHVHGSTNVVEAIQKSCNVFFYQLIHKVGLETFAAYARKFGFGRGTSVDIGEETAGLVPSTEYFDRVYGKGRWTQGYLVSLAIGQGELGVSPLQTAAYIAALANGGTLLQPHAVRYVRNKSMNRVEEFQYHSQDLGFSPHVMELIREGLKRVVNSQGGTGGSARLPDIVVAGKTGTAENPHGDDHSWFVGFAPYENPRIAIATMVENAGYGGTKAAPISARVIERYLHGPGKPRAQKPHRSSPTGPDTVRTVTQLVP